MVGFIGDFNPVDASNTLFGGIGIDVNVMTPSSARKFTQALAGALARWHNDLGATPTVAGTATAVTVTLNQAFTAYGASAGQIANGEVIALKMTSAATGATTLNINTIGAKAIRREGDTAIAASDWLANSTVLLRYDTAYNSAAGAWVLLNQNRGTTLVEFDIPNATVRPLTDGSLAVGDTTHGLSIVNFSGVLGSGAYWGNAAISITISSTTLRFLGATTAYSFDSLIDLSSGASSVGLKFPASQVASANVNTLDDYAEGTTTPTVTSGTGAFTTVACTLTYTKIGNRVLWDAVVTITTNNTAATSIIIPLPFTVGAGVAFAGINSTSNFAMVGSAANTQTAATFVKYDGTYPGGSGITLRVGGEYRV